MPLDAAIAPRVAGLNHRYRHHGAVAVLEHALQDAEVGRVALVSSFGAESVVLLHMVATLRRDLPVLFIDTEMLFAETLSYQAELAERLHLSNVQIIRADAAAVVRRDPFGLLHRADPDACCALRKAEPLERALAGFDGWVTGRKRYQGGRRASLDFFEVETPGRMKINPLAHWATADVQDYIAENRLPRHPLVSKGYPSIGCTPCTSAVAAGEDPRAGRWRGMGKDECGIHLIGGQVQRADKEDKKMSQLVRDTGFVADDFTGKVLELGPETDPAALPEGWREAALIALTFPAFNDGRGFTLARTLRARGYAGRLRARGPVIADQYTMARRAGFDEVEIPAALAARQGEAQWLARSDWTARDYQSRLRGPARAAA